MMEEDEYYNDEPGVTCPKCNKMFACGDIQNDDKNYLSPCCRAKMGELNK